MKSSRGCARRCDVRLLSSYFIRLAFWAVFMIGIFDAFLSFLRVEGLHTTCFGEMLEH